MELAVQVLSFFVLSFLPGYLLVRFFKNGIISLAVILYAFGLGLLFNIVVGLVANFTFGVTVFNLMGTYTVLLVILSFFSAVWGKDIKIKWQWNLLAIPVVLYVLAVGFQWQTTLVSPNLIGSDIHLEYYTANLVIEQSYWNPMRLATTINTCLGIVLLTPFYSLVTGMDLVWVFKLICPMIFAFLPLALYQIFRMQFGIKVAVLSTIFFITLPMFTMDMTQLIRQQHSELFFILAVLVVMDIRMRLATKVLLGSLFCLGMIVTHYGFAIGGTGYFLIGCVMVLVLVKLFKERYGVGRLKEVLSSALVILILAMASVGLFFSYYNWAGDGTLLEMSTIPVQALEQTATQARIPPSDVEPKVPVTTNLDVSGIETEELPELVKNYPFLNPLWREPLLQTAIGLDFTRASVLGKVWRVFQFLVEICLLVGFFVFVLRKEYRAHLAYRAFVVTSFFVVLGMYTLSTYSYGMGASRVWQTTLLFASPLFIIGAGALSKWIFRREFVVIGSLAIFIPYFIFNSGIVFELGKMEMKGFIDVPYSVALSGHRVDIATVFDEEDVEAVNWLKERTGGVFGKSVLYSDAHGVRLLIQKFGLLINPELVVGGNLKAGRAQSLEGMEVGDNGYIFLRKWNVQNDMITVQAEYASRMSFDISHFPVAQEKIRTGEVIFDNGAKIIKTR